MQMHPRKWLQRRVAAAVAVVVVVMFNREPVPIGEHVSIHKAESYSLLEQRSLFKRQGQRCDSNSDCQPGLGQKLQGDSFRHIGPLKLSSHILLQA